MNSQYIQNTGRTDVDYVDGIFQNRICQHAKLIHSLIGMLSEMSELREALLINDKVTIREEVGDYCWYIARGLEALGVVSITAQPVADGTSTLEELSVMANLIKRIIFYDVDPFKYRAELIVHYNNLFNYLAGVAAESGFTIQEAMDLNIAKLRARYPDKFSHDLAVERDLKAERKILEGPNETNP